MENFTDVNGAGVTLAFQDNVFDKRPRHIFVICRYNDAWLLTRHSIRGLEFPGGKVEEEETLEDAARREVTEETGGILGNLVSIGEYKVADAAGSFVKRIFYGEVIEVILQDDYLETAGPVLVNGDLLTERIKDEYSFIMKDNVVKRSLEFLAEKFDLK
jgi:8-oxo-dGTP diphosphatase